MGFLGTLMGAGAGWLFFADGSRWGGYIAVAIAVVCLWSWGVMHNQMVEAAKRRPNYTGGFFDFTEQDALSVGNGISTVNMAATIAALILLIVAAIMKFI